jgi:hypothetical protein
MEKPEFFEQVDKRGYYRPNGDVPFEKGVTMVADAMIYARENGMTEMLVDVRGLMSAFSSITIFDRYAMAVRWAEIAGTALRVALVARPEMLDPDTIALLMAQNRGADGEVFTNDAEALVWLGGRPA